MSEERKRRDSSIRTRSNSMNVLREEISLYVEFLKLLGGVTINRPDAVSREIHSRVCAALRGEWGTAMNRTTGE